MKISGTKRKAFVLGWIEFSCLIKMFFSVNTALIEQGYQTVNLIVKEFLGILPFDCIQILVETNAKYGKQPIDLNVALAAVGQLVKKIFSSILINL